MIDPNISLQVQPPQQQDPMANMARMLQLKDLMQRGQGNQLEIQAMQQQQQEQEVMRQAFGESGGDWDKFVKDVSGKVSPQTLIKLQDGLTESRRQKEAADDLKIKNNAARTNAITEAALGLVDMDEEKRAANWPVVRNSLVQRGVVSPEMIPDKYPGDQPFRMLLNQTLLEKREMDKEIQRRAKSAESRAQNAQGLAEMTATANIRNQQRQADSPTEAKIAAWAAQGVPWAIEAHKLIKQRVPVPGTDVPFSPAVAQQRASIAGATAAARANAGMEGAAAPSYSGSVPGQPVQKDEAALKGVPAGTANIVKMMVEGRMPLPGGFALRSPYWQNLLNLAAQYEPGFDATQWRVRLDTRVDFAKGKAALQIRSLNTLIKHLGQLWDAADKLDNTGLTGSTKTGNYLVNLGKEQFGSEGVKSWETAATASGSEMAALLKGASPTDQEVNQQKKVFNRDDPKSAQQVAIRDTLKLAFGRMAAVKDQYEGAFKKQKDFKFLTKEAEKIAKDKLGVDPNEIDPGQEQPQVQPGGTVALRAPDGTVQEVPAEMADHYIRLGAKRVQ